MKIKCLQKLIDNVRGKKYIHIYPPIYNEHKMLKLTKPSVYNEFGQKMDVFFLRDRHLEAPYGYNSKYFLWDRYNYGLDTHFYTGNAMLETMGNPVKKYSYLTEPRVKQPKDYSRLEKSKILASEFEKVLTHDEQLLNNLPNAFFFPGCAAAWVNPQGLDCWQEKNKMVSMLSSHKKMCPLHYLRINVAKKCKAQGLADTFGTFDGGGFVKMIDILKDYRYTIAFENEVSPYFFTERIISAFLTMTVPIYLGATKIDKFFNSDGMVIIDEIQAQNIEEVLKQCSLEDYGNRLSAMKENYNKALAYLNNHDLLYESLFLPKEKQTLDINYNFLNEGK
ncbi:MAG: glycosyltransferase family 10 [Alphaproteobacteria bacterium]